MRKTTQEEINKLYAFTRKHYVKYYDLQTELVDHLANGMEERWAATPEISFEENLQHEFKKFGVFGFSEVVEKRQNAMNKKYWKLIWKEIQLELSTSKTLFLFVLMTGVFTFLLQLESGYQILSYLTLSVGIIGMIYFALKHFLRKKKEKQTNKKYLLEVMIEKAGGSFQALILPYYFLYFLNAADLTSSMLISLALALLVSSTLLIVYVALVALPKKKDDILTKAYPELELTT